MTSSTDAGLVALGGILRLHYAGIFPFFVASAGSIIRSFPCRFVISLFSAMLILGMLAI